MVSESSQRLLRFCSDSSVTMAKGAGSCASSGGVGNNYRGRTRLGIKRDSKYPEIHLNDTDIPNIRHLYKNGTHTVPLVSVWTLVIGLDGHVLAG